MVNIATTHEIAKKLLDMPNVDLFVKDKYSLEDTYHVESVELCTCEAEAWMMVVNEKEMQGR